MKYYAAFTNNSWSESLGKTVTIKYWEEKEHSFTDSMILIMNNMNIEKTTSQHTVLIISIISSYTDFGFLPYC